MVAAIRSSEASNENLSWSVPVELALTVDRETDL